MHTVFGVGVGAVAEKVVFQKAEEDLFIMPREKKKRKEKTETSEEQRKNENKST